MKKGTQVYHKEHGDGIVQEDIDKDCYDDEVIVKFAFLPIIKQNSKSIAGGSTLIDTDIFKKSELTLR